MTVTVDEFEVADPVDAWSAEPGSVIPMRSAGSAGSHRLVDGRGAAPVTRPGQAVQRGRRITTLRHHVRDVRPDGDDLGASLSRPLDRSAYPRRMTETVESTDDVVVIHTDGACSGNPGPGGWGVLLRWGEHQRELCGGEAAPDHQQPDGADRGDPGTGGWDLDPSRFTVRLHTDSTYVRNGITSWLASPGSATAG